MLVRLYRACGLILLSDKGITYLNQTGGHACYQSGAKGYFAPLYPGELEDKLRDYFVGDKWSGWCNEKIDKETAHFIDDCLEKIGYSWIKVDSNFYNDSHEAWIYVKISQNSRIENFTGGAILTWRNSD